MRLLASAAAYLATALVPFGCIGRDDPISSEDSASDGPGDAGDSDEAGFCEPACVEPIDCCDQFGDPIGGTCRADYDTYPWRFTCDGGACRSGSCRSDAECQALGDTRSTCVAVSSTSICVRVCDGDDECDEGDACEPFPGGPSTCQSHCDDDSECPDIAHCFEGDCVYDGCTSDADCEIFGGTCEPDGTCRCHADDECGDGETCVSV